MHPKKTFELRISFPQEDSKAAESTKQALTQWLIGYGEESFVEGAVDNLSVDFDYDNPDRDLFAESGGNVSPLIIYRYDLEYLRDLKAKIESNFAGRVDCSEHWLETEVWLEGWKSSFKAFQTEKFYIYPPWEKPEAELANLQPIEIEPGMAFGTGQHATTQLCLRELEQLEEFEKDQMILDVGTGTGILSIALAKLGYSSIIASDIDTDAVAAAKENARVNNCQIKIEQGSVPESCLGQCKLVIANILMVVIRKIAVQLAAAVAPGGYLLVSGVLDIELDEMRMLGQKHGLSFLQHSEQDGWVALLFQKKG